MNFIAEARKRAGLSQAEVAEALGLSTGTVAAWELMPGPEGHSFRLGRLNEIARVLKVRSKDLLAWWMEMAREAKAS